jgi:outer membrane protein assembly factor BamB
MMARLATGVLAVVLAAPAAADDWPQFRGPNASGVSSSKNLPTEFSESENVLWKADLGEGIASPIIVGGKVFSTAMTAPTTFAVFAHDAATGKQLWKRDLATGPLPRITPPNSHASSTPASDGQRVYVYFSTIGLLAFDAATGKERWKTPRPDMLAGYAVPVVCQANGRTDIVVAGTGKMKGYDPATGKELWTCNTLVRTVMTTPVVKDGVIYIAVQSYGDSTRTLKYALLDWMDTNQDKKLARAEVPKEFRERFEESDKNNDGFIADAELDSAFQSKGNRVGGGNIIQAIKGGGTGDVTKTHLLWNVTNKYPSNLTSPLVSGDRLLVVKAGGVSTSLSSATCKPNWELERIDNLGDHFASPVAADGKIFIAGRNGFIVVIADSASLEVLAKNDMGGEIIATPAIADGRLYVRTREKLYCIGKK